MSATLSIFVLALLTAVGSAQPATRIVSPEVTADRRVTFRLLAPNAHDVLLTGEFMQGSKSFSKNEDGVWSVTVGPLEPEIARLQSIWRELGNQPELARAGSERMRDYVVGLRKKLESSFSPPSVKGISSTGQPFLMWRNRQYATNRRNYDRGVLQIEGEAKPVETAPLLNKDTADNDDEPPPPPKRALGLDPDLKKKRSATRW